MRRRKELDKGISALVLVLYAVVWLIYLIMAMTNQGEPTGAIRAIGIIRTIVQILVFLVLLYNAWGWSNNLIVRVVMLVITAWLIFCTVAPYFPGSFGKLGEFMYPIV